MSKTVWLHRVCAVGWTIALIPALLWWRESIVFVIIASVYANIKSDWGAAEAADDHRVIEQLEEINRKLDQVLTDRVTR